MVQPVQQVEQMLGKQLIIGDSAKQRDLAGDEKAAVLLLSLGPDFGRPILDELDEIAAIPWIDVLWVGHYDLTASLGIPGRFDHPDYAAALGRIVEACQGNGIAAGISTDSLADAHALLDQGFRFVAYGHDLVLLRTALRTGIDDLRAARGVASPA